MIFDTCDFFNETQDPVLNQFTENFPLRKFGYYSPNKPGGSGANRLDQGLGTFLAKRVIKVCSVQ